MKLALKVDVDTYRGTREGVPRLTALLRKYGAGATFLFSLGPDHTGRAVRRVLRRGFVGKVARTSVLAHYGLKTLLYGTLLPGPDIGRSCRQILLDTRSAGFETGIHCWDHVRWQDNVAGADAAWTEREMARACERFEAVFKTPATCFGAAGWQSNAHAARFQERAGFAYASDTRGREPFRPLWSGEPVGCLQLPTTLPTLDELIGIEDDPVQRLLKLTRECPPQGHVFTLHAELEGGRLMGMFEQILQGWRAQGYELVSMRQVSPSPEMGAVPRCEVVYGSVPGRSGTLALQGAETGGGMPR